MLQLKKDPSSPTPPQSEDFWRDALRRLAGRKDDLAWTLVVEDLNQPAFLQPPLPERDHDKMEVKIKTPDELDLLPTAKNHNLKLSRAMQPDMDEWVYALLSIQTMSGYFGHGNQGISRMNGGYGSRAVVELRRSHQPGGLWRDALEGLARHRRDVLAGPWGFDPAGLVLVWLEPWDGTTSLGLHRLDPFYLEICRRIRLRYNPQKAVCAASIPAREPRLTAKDLRGRVGDAWLPIDLTKDSVLTVGPSGINPELMRRLIFEDGMKLASLQRPQPDTTDRTWLYVSVLVRGQGTTEGFHEKSIRIPCTAKEGFFRWGKSDRERLAALGKTCIRYAGTVQDRVIKPAVFTYLDGIPLKQISYKRSTTALWWQRAAGRFQALWAADYFPWLWQAMEKRNLVEARRDWVQCVRNHALTVFQETLQTMPSHAGRHYCARTRAERVFGNALNDCMNLAVLREELHLKTLPEQNIRSEAPDIRRYVTGIAEVLASKDFATGERAALRRMVPGQPLPIAFFGFAVRHLPKNWERLVDEWAVVVAGMAIMAPDIHDPRQSFGRVLADTGFSERRLERLLSACGETCRTLFLKTVRFLAAKNQEFNWYDAGRLILTRDLPQREELCRHIARDYYRVAAQK